MHAHRMKRLCRRVRNSFFAVARRWLKQKAWRFFFVFVLLIFPLLLIFLPDTGRSQVEQIELVSANHREPFNGYDSFGEVNNEKGQSILQISGADMKSERERWVGNRLQELEAKQNSGVHLSTPEAFALRYLRFSLTKSKVSGEFSSDHCDFDIPIPPNDWTYSDEKKAISKLTLYPGFEQDMKEATFLSLDHTLCTTRHPETTSLPKLPPSFLTPAADGFPSLLEFNNVCPLFNLDSLKMSQRSLLIFDNTNDADKRCVACPNPQMNKIWQGLGNECGIMWLHQVNSKGTLRDYQDCYTRNKALAKAHGQRLDPGETEAIVGGLFYERPTLLLQFVQMNPGHQLWDFLFSIVPLIYDMKERNNRVFERVIVQQIPGCSDRVWTCSILRKLGFFVDSLSGDGNNLIYLYPGVLPCFRRLITPVSGWNHENKMLTTGAISWLRDTLCTAYGLGIGAANYHDIKLLLYPHKTKGEAGKRRAWVDVEDAILGIPDYQPLLVHDFSTISVDDQAKMFNQHNVLVMSHGGQMGNTMFCREGTVVVEVTCGGYSQMALGDGTYTRGLGLRHLVYRPCECIDGHSDESNYLLGQQELLSVIEYALSLPSGTTRRTCHEIPTRSI